MSQDDKPHQIWLRSVNQAGHWWKAGDPGDYVICKAQECDLLRQGNRSDLESVILPKGVHPLKAELV